MPDADADAYANGDSDSDPDTHPQPSPPPGGVMDAASRTWLALVALTLLSVLVAAHGLHPLWRLAATWAVALLCALKAQLLVRDYLQARQAGPVFHRLVQCFAVLAPLLLAASAVLEAWGTLTGQAP